MSICLQSSKGLSLSQIARYLFSNSLRKAYFACKATVIFHSSCALFCFRKMARPLVAKRTRHPAYRQHVKTPTERACQDWLAASPSSSPSFWSFWQTRNLGQVLGCVHVPKNASLLSSVFPLPIRSMMSVRREDLLYRQRHS